MVMPQQESIVKDSYVEGQTSVVEFDGPNDEEKPTTGE